MTWNIPLALALLLLVPVLVGLVVREERRRHARLAKLGDVELLLPQSIGVSLARRRWLRVLAVLGYALLVVALAGPQFGDKTVLLPRKGLDVLFALDVSRSMRARDVQPDRLERAKAEISAALDRLGDNRMGLVAFAGTAFVQCPLTTDKEAVRLFLQGLRPEVVPQGGTALAAGMETGLNQFLAEEEADASTKKSGRVLVVITDGEDHEGGIDDVAASLKKAGVTVVFIGVGSTIGEPIPIVDEHGAVIGYLKDRDGSTVMTRMSPEVLEQVATTTGGTFIDGTTRPDLGMAEVEAKVASLEKRDLEARSKVEYVDRSTPVAALGLLLLVLALLLPERTTRSLTSSPTAARRRSA
jgi:Ca-activated chloride channel family protein